MKLLVFVPGIMGSVLRSEDEQVWPPTPFEAIFGYDRINELMREDLEVAGTILKVGPKAVYKTLLNDLDRCGFTKNGTDKRLLEFAYDWRRSNLEATALLADALDEAAMKLEGQEFEVTFLGHSMGGLVVRCLLESGNYSDRTWFSRVKWLIMLGTPQSGAPLALHRLGGQEGTIGLSGADVRRLANDSRYPSLYELIPPSRSALTISGFSKDVLPSPMDPFEEPVRSRLGMNQVNIDSARGFWGKLELSRKPEFVNYFTFIGSNHLTLVRNEVRGTGGATVQVMRADSGDGTVPVSSAILPSIPLGYSSKKHQNIFSDRQLRRYLYQILDAPSGVVPQSASHEATGEDEDAVGFSFNKDSYAPHEEIQLSISFVGAQENPSIVLNLVEVDAATGEAKTGGLHQSISARLRGVALTEFGMVIDNQFPPGMYELQPVGLSTDDAEPTFLIVRGF